ncbi:Tubulin-tyrosine ligase/Tubulin polyglutamylase [Carpediemonas membranifera]|uniref:Tubulin-tyrosine ligase/Tubulin polyglutamylase n=1 Tax=Carpediemonas membranifera TaxID=201153 RepID=A0A8J6E6D7_9EUKA|nr:Tubulin-tyrosine ligase/Tubulin polyglutamylase [Carpediemonas membranifera]|eukprot:KAG9389455.1 Tubulin-tyrosine ligase/Tubulin polyglutamylase [Carpediemonas membranifera]
MDQSDSEKDESAMSEVLKPAAKPLGQLFALKSVFQHRPKTISFNHDLVGSSICTSTKRAVVLKMSGAKTNIVRETFRANGFKTTTSDTSSWTVHWGKAQKFASYNSLTERQYVNHWPGTFELGRKDRLARNIAHMCRRIGSKEFGFFTPRTFIVPGDYKALKNDMAESKGMYIYKPCASARGIGIKVIDSISQVNKGKYSLVQKYISTPYLIDGRKIDIRIYVAVTSIDPLKVYVYPEGLVRFATKRYKKGHAAKKSRMMHLTNYSVNVKGADFVQPGADLPLFSVDSPPEFDESWFELSKWSLTMLAAFMEQRGDDFKATWESITDVIVRALLCGDSALNSAFKANCPSGNAFEMFGVDIMLDAALKPWLIEINTSPSTASSSPMDRVIKSSVLSDLLDLVGLHAPKTPLPPRSGRIKRSLRDLDDFIPEELPDHAKLTLLELEEELHRCGRWRILFPAADSPYLRLMEIPRYNNILACKWLATRTPLSVLGPVDAKLINVRRRQIQMINRHPPSSFNRPVTNARPVTDPIRARVKPGSPKPLLSSSRGLGSRVSTRLDSGQSRSRSRRPMAHTVIRTPSQRGIVGKAPGVGRTVSAGPRRAGVSAARLDMIGSIYGAGIYM